MTAGELPAAVAATVGATSRHLREADLGGLPVLNRDKRLVGVISLVDLARRDLGASAGSSDRSTGDAEERAQVAA